MATLRDSCANCQHFDGDAYCTLPRDQRRLAGYIHEAESVVCDQHEVDRDRQQLELLKEEDRLRAAEGIAYENALYRLGGQY